MLTNQSSFQNMTCHTQNGYPILQFSVMTLLNVFWIKNENLHDKMPFNSFFWNSENEIARQKDTILH